MAFTLKKKLFKGSKKNQKTEKELLKEQFDKKDYCLMLSLSIDDRWAQNIAQETIDRLAVYVKEGLFDMNEVKDSVFERRLKEVLQPEESDNSETNKEETEVKPEDIIEPEVEVVVGEVVEEVVEEKTVEEKQAEENNKIIDLVEVISNKEKNEEAQKDDTEKPKKDKKPSKEKSKKETNKKEDKKSTESKQQQKPEKKQEDNKQQQNENVTNEDITIDTVSEYLSSESYLDGVVKGINTKYTNVFNKIRDDVVDLYVTLNGSDIGKEIVKEQSTAIINCIDCLSNTNKETMDKYIKSNKYLKSKSADIHKLINISKTPTVDNRKKILVDSISAIFVAPEIDRFIRNTAKETKNKDANNDNVIAAIKTKIITLKNELSNPDVARKKLVRLTNRLNGFTNSVNSLSNTKENDRSKYQSKFIPKDDSNDKKKNTEALLFGDDVKLAKFDYSKMGLDLNNTSTSDNVTKQNNKTISYIYKALDGLYDKAKYKISINKNANETFNLSLNRTDGAIYNFVIDTGVVIGHGIYIFAGGYYISLNEKDIVKRLLDDPNKFKLSPEEINKCVSYLFRVPYLYNYIDMSGYKSKGIQKLTQEEYLQLGDTLYTILYTIFNKYHIECRFRFSEFKNINDFTLSHDTYLKNILQVENIPVLQDKMEIVYKDNKITVSYANQVVSFNLI